MRAANDKMSSEICDTLLASFVLSPLPAVSPAAFSTYDSASRGYDEISCQPQKPHYGASENFSRIVPAVGVHNSHTALEVKCLCLRRSYLGYQCWDFDNKLKTATVPEGAPGIEGTHSYAYLYSCPLGSGKFSESFCERRAVVWVRQNVRAQANSLAV